MEKLTRKQAAVIGAYTGVLVGRWQDLHEYIDGIMERPVYSHELGDKKIAREIKAKAAKDFLAIVAD